MLFIIISYALVRLMMPSSNSIIVSTPSLPLLLPWILPHDDDCALFHSLPSCQLVHSSSSNSSVNPIYCRLRLPLNRSFQFGPPTWRHLTSKWGNTFAFTTYFVLFSINLYPMQTYPQYITKSVRRMSFLDFKISGYEPTFSSVLLRKHGSYRLVIPVIHTCPLSVSKTPTSRTMPANRELGRVSVL